MSYYATNGKLTAQSGKRDKLVNILLQAVELLNKNDDCLHYVIKGSDKEANSVWVSEVWTTKQSRNAALGQSGIKSLINQAAPILAAFPQQTELEVLGGKGL